MWGEYSKATTERAVLEAEIGSFIPSRGPKGPDQGRSDCQNQELYGVGHLTEAITFEQGTQPALRDPASPPSFHSPTSAPPWTTPVGNQKAK